MGISAPTGMVATTVLVNAEMASTLPALELTTYTNVPVGVTATPIGFGTGIVVVTFLVPVLMTARPVPLLTYAVLPLGLSARSMGPERGMVATTVLVAVLITDTEFDPELVT